MDTVAGAPPELGAWCRYTEHEYDEALIKTLRATCLKFIETEHDVSLQEVASFIRNAVRAAPYTSTATFFPNMAVRPVSDADVSGKHDIG